MIAGISFTYIGRTYYQLPEELRFEHPMYNLLKPSGFVGHGLGIAGTAFILIGLFSYMVRKRMRIFYEWGKLKYWLEFHIFMCTLGTVLILFHTSFKFGGIVSVGFWSLAIVWISGVAGRFIYIRIPRTIEGRELSVNELQKLKNEMDNDLQKRYGITISNIGKNNFSNIKLKLIENKIPAGDFSKVRKLIRRERILQKRINQLDKMRKLFNYWHVLHLPFALIMLIILVIHVSVVLFFGYKWVF